MKTKFFRHFTIFGLVVFGMSLFSSAAEALAPYCFPMEDGEQYICSFVTHQPQFTRPEPVRDDFVITQTYGRLADYANVHAAPGRDSEIVRNVGDGFLFVTTRGMFQDSNGEWWHMINLGEYVHRDDIKMTDQSTFRGVEVNYQPTRPFGWVVVRDFIPSFEPGGEPDERLAKMKRYDFFEVYNAVEADDGWIWYDIGDGRWINQQFVSLVDVDPRPEGVGPNDLWTEIDLYEQTLAAYEGDRMVFATLISSGLNRWPTYEGLFQVDPENRFVETKMGGAEGRVDYYFVEDVPHTMYFDLRNEIALHGAYWHDRFGYKHSHGCVNMPPQDSEWIYYWSQDKAEEDFWVWVHESNPSQYFERYDPEDPFVGA
ncbi:MAG: L,D-transpeptidase [Chloroflexota bacterium]